MGRESTVRGRVGHRLVMAIVVGVLAMAAAMPLGSQADAAPKSPHLAWSTCYRDVGTEFGLAFECAQLNVPLDHDRPRGRTIQLALVRLPATDPDKRIGSMFVNPGGPGGSGVDALLFFLGPFADEIWGPEIRQRFDLVGFDPRGVARSTGIRCFGTIDQAVKVFAPFAFPLTAEQEQVWIDGDTLLADRCDRRAGQIAEHMSTANVARDLDLMRAAVGDDQLTYFGVSYGSMLGATYANLFPDRVRAVVVDGILDPVAWSNVEGEVPFSTRLRSDVGAQATLDRVLDLCESAAPGNCALAPDASARFDELAETLSAGPVEVEDPGTGETFTVTYQDLIARTLQALYDPFSQPMLADDLALLEQVVGTTAAQVSPGKGTLASWGNKRGFPRYFNFVESFPAVTCTDGNNPSDYDVWRTEGAAADAAHGYFGRIWTWASSPCAQWPFEDADRYVGPWDARTSNDVLVVGNLYDPATRYEGATTVRSLLPNSALITVDLAGHVAAGANGCAGHAETQYLVDPSIAPALDGLSCPLEYNPFDLLAGSSGGDGFGLSPAMRMGMAAQARGLEVP